MMGLDFPLERWFGECTDITAKTEHRYMKVAEGDQELIRKHLEIRRETTQSRSEFEELKGLLERLS